MSEMFQFDPYLMQKIHFENESFTFFEALQKPFFPQIPNVSVNWIEWSNSMWATGAPRLAKPPRPGPCLDFAFQYDLIRNNQSKKFGVEYWALPGSNLPWSP